nr:hypothetical protein [Tanacetum cinerariifolium]
AARRWLEKEPPRSITTWEDLVSKFINEFFPPSRTTNLRNEISNFQQKFDESFHEAWERYKDLLRACPHHGFTELHQLDTFYNALNRADQDSLNAAAGGNLLEKSPQDALMIIKNKSKVRNSRSKPIASPVNDCDNHSSSELAKLTHAVNQQTSAVTTAMTAMLKQLQSNPPPAQVKAVEEICVTCGGAHLYYQCLAAGGNTFPEYRDNIQGYVQQPQETSIRNFHLNELEKIKRMNDVSLKAKQNQIDMMNIASTSGSGTLPGNTIANSKSKLKAITTRSGLVTEGPTVPNPPKTVNPEEDECVEENVLPPVATLSQNSGITFKVTFQQPHETSIRNFYLNELEKIKRMNDVSLKAMQNQIDMVKNELKNEMKTSIQTSLSNQTNEIKNMMASLLQINTASTSGSGTLPGNTIANPKGELKAITTRSGLVTERPTVPNPPKPGNPEEDECVEETYKDPNHAEYNIKVPTPPPVQKPKPQSQRNFVIHTRESLSSRIPYPSRMLKQKQQEKDDIQIQKFWNMFKQLHLNITLAEALVLMPKYQMILKALLSNKEKL